MNMIEKIARAQAAICSNCKMLDKEDWKSHLQDAKAAIEAMREPTEEMLACIDTTDDPGTAAIYTEMIDAALKETETK